MNETRTILYVDDEEINLMLFEINLGKKYNLIKATSGFDGLKLLEEHPEIGITISDMKMPGMNGIEFIKKSKERFPNVIYFILSGFGISDEINSALEEKLINAYFMKPFNMNEIETSINSAIA